MSLVQCQTCGGVYDQIGDDGVRYAHVCPPIVGVKVVKQDGTLAIVTEDEAKTAKMVLGRVPLPRRNGRNENPQRRADGTAGIVAEGLGVTTIATTDARSGEVVVSDALGAGTDLVRA